MEQVKVLIAMSGGVDSTAACLLLRDKGYDLVGCTFRTRYTSQESIESAVQSAHQLNVEHHVIDLTETFDAEVIAYFRQEYLAGRTPNPCVCCNRKIKFGVLQDVMRQLGCQKIATGHYAQIVTDSQRSFLYRAKDAAKDQTYFLWQLSSEQLSHVLFPLGEMTKQQVRDYLREKGFTVLASKGESQDICFIQDDYRSFLQIPSCEGKYILTESLQRLATQRHALHHSGYVNYTIGQRKGLGVSLGESAFVTHIDALRNEVTLGTHDELFTHDVPLQDVRFDGDEGQPVMAQIRYRSRPQSARLVHQQEQWILHFEDPVWAVTPGQSAVMYQDNRLVGGGIIL